MQSQNIYNQMQGIQEQMAPWLSEYGAMPEEIKNQINEKFNHNMPAWKNAAALESKAYSLPGDLMGQYDQEYGGKRSVSAMARMNSIMKNMGAQFGISNAANQAADRSQGRIDDIINSLTDQYTRTLDSFGMQHNMLLPQWQQLQASEERARQAALDRAHYGGSAAVTDSGINKPFDPFDLIEEHKGLTQGEINDNRAIQNAAWNKPALDARSRLSGGSNPKGALFPDNFRNARFGASGGSNPKGALFPDKFRR